MNKVLISLIFGLCVACHAFDGGIRIDIDARRNFIPLKNVTVGSGLTFTYPNGWPNAPFDNKAKSEENDFISMRYQYNHLVIEGMKPLSNEWQKFEFSFTPEKTEELKLYVRGGYDQNDSKTSWVAYRDFYATGTELANGNFSEIKDGVPDGWLINDGLVASSDKTRFIYGSFAAFGIKALQVKAGEKVTISFMARNGIKTDWGVMPVKASAGAATHSSLNLEISALGFKSCEEAKFDKVNKIVSCLPNRSGGVLIPVNQDLSKYSKVKVVITPLAGSLKKSDFSGAIFQESYYPCQQIKCSPVEMNKPAEILFDLSKATRNNTKFFRLYISKTEDKTEAVEFKINKIEFLYPEQIDSSCYWYFSDILAFPLLSDKGLTPEEVRAKSPDKNFKFGRSTPEPRFFSNPVPAGKGVITKESVSVEVLEEYGVNRTASIRFGFPLPRGGLFNIKRIEMSNPSGEPVPFQSAATAFWPDKSLKWVLLQFDAPLKANEKANYQVVFGANVDEAEKDNRLTMADNGDIITVNTGKLQAIIGKKKFNLVKNVKVRRDGKWIDAGGFAMNGLELRDEKGRLFSCAMIDPESVEVEEQGPERIVFKVRGKYGTADKGETNMSYEVRLSFARGSEKVGMAVSTTNTNLDNEFTDIDSLSCAFVPASPIQGGKVLLDANNLQALRQGPCKTEEIVLNPNSQTRLFQEDEQILSGAKGHENARLTGAVEVDTATGPVRAVLKDCWQRWPKAFSVNRKELVFELLPKQPSRNFYRNLPYYLLFPFCEGKYRLKWGVSFTENIDLDFGSTKSLAEADAEANMPVVAVLSRDWYYQTKVFPGATPVKDKQFELWDQAVARWFNEHMEFNKRIRPYGFLNYGDWFGERGGNWGNNEYDTAHGLFMDFIRTGNRDHFHWAQRAAQHDADVDCMHAYPDSYYLGGKYTHSISHTGGCLLGRKLTLPLSGGIGLASNGHTWLNGMVDDWFLTGNARVQQAAFKLGEHIVWNTTTDEKNFGIYLRTQGYPLMALGALYDLEGDPLYRQKADEIAAFVIKKQQFDKGGAWYSLAADSWHSGDKCGEPVQVCFQVGLISMGMVAYHKMTHNPDAAKSLIASCGWLANSWSREANGWPFVAKWDGKPLGRGPNSEGNMDVAPPLAYTALLAADERFYEIARRTIEAMPLKKIGGVGKGISSRIIFASDLIDGIYQWQVMHPDAPRVCPDEPVGQIKDGTLLKQD